MKLRKVVAAVMTASLMVGSVAEAASFKSSSSSDSSSSSYPQVPSAPEINSASGPGTFTLDGVGSCTPGAESTKGTIDTGVVLGVNKTSGAEIVENIDEEFNDVGTTTSIATDKTHEVLDMDKKGVGLSTYIRFIKPLGKNVENIACQQLVEQGVKIAKAKAEQIEIEGELARMRADIERKKAEIELRELEFRLSQLESGESNEPVSKETSSEPKKAEKCFNVRQPDGSIKKVCQ